MAKGPLLAPLECVIIYIMNASLRNFTTQFMHAYVKCICVCVSVCGVCKVLLTCNVYPYIMQIRNEQLCT